MKKIIAIIFLSCLTRAGSAQQAEPLDVNGIVNKLTLEEKARIVIGAGMNIPGLPGASTVGVTQEKVPGAAGTSQVVDRLGLKKVVMADGPAGVRISPKRERTDQTFYATGFPVATMLASTFDLKLMEKVGGAFGNEVKEYGVDLLLAPALNIHRDPLGGRNFEYYSEDPLVSGKMAAAFVRGLQAHGVGATIKHFAANNQETNRTKSNTIVSERALREIYLKGFEIAIKESDPWSVMSSYNKINGHYASESPELLTTILREEWGYKGFVMTDWFGGEDVVKQMIAGNDLIMPGIPRHEQTIIQAVKDGKLSGSILDRNVAAILTIFSKTPTFANFTPSNKPDLDKNKGVAKEAAVEGMVLLKNDNNTLPLSSGSKPVALFGVGSFETVAGGTGSGDVNKAYVISLAEGFQKKGLTLSQPLIKKYEKYIEGERAKMPAKRFFFEPDKLVSELTWSASQLDSIAEASSIGVFTLARTSGEFVDRKIEDDFLLTPTEAALIKTASASFRNKGKRLVVLLNIGGVIETASWKDYADAILIIWQPGQEAGLAVAEVLSGAVNPSGKLPMTFPVKYEDTPSSKNFPGKELEPNPNPGAFSFQGIKSEVVYEEDIYVGYRYFDSFNQPVSFPFGYGMSYTTFGLSGLKVSQSKDGNIIISVNVKNTGAKAGKEVIQVYTSAPKGKLSKPAKELKAFGKTRLLQPGESESVQLTFTRADLASFDESSSSWITDAGAYKIQVGTSASTLLLQTTLTIKSPLARKVNKVFVPEREINVLKR
jgi:beta-glucosidase